MNTSIRKERSIILEERKISRERFSSGLAVFFATLGSAVGLGNIWKFPHKVGSYGGGAFLFVYLLCILFVGMPVMISEFYIGRKTRKNAVGAFERLKPGSPWKSIGLMGVGAAYLIMFFYSAVGGWVYSYVWKTLKGDFIGITADTAAGEFGKTIIGPIPPIFWQFIVICVVSIILILGVQKGIEKITKTLMPVLFILLIICAARAITLPGAAEGLRFLFHIDFSQINTEAILEAMGLAFFKLSLGMGTMITYASYYTQDNDMIGTSAKVAISDTIVSLLAGIAIFPTVFSFGMEPGAGPGLLFITIPLVFSKIWLGNILLPAFFILASIAATTAMLSMMEVPIAYFSEEKGLSRTKAVLINGIVIFVIGILAALSADEGALLGQFRDPLLQKTFFDVFDYLSSNIILPLGGLFIAIFVGFMIKKEDFIHEISNQGTLSNQKLASGLYFVLRYVTPVLLIIVFLNMIGIIKLA